ncbi:hypothetical protein DL346_22430 [Paenibacillus montanisoli]|uniref:Uncharacterized protein n=1 Tax=Paenibacillus montanisoli TaxID=2081970 RepID=A0A328TWB9_9BACL|nr:hypothetical protein DL346_22430 [Paenibacillus montanisoli]
MIIFLAAIVGINSNLYKAAEVDGAGKWKQAIHITLPCMALIKRFGLRKFSWGFAD